METFTRIRVKSQNYLQKSKIFCDAPHLSKVGGISKPGTSTLLPPASSPSPVRHITGSWKPRSRFRSSTASRTRLLEIGSLWTGAKWFFGISSLPQCGHPQLPYTLCGVGMRRGRLRLISARSGIALLVEHQARGGIWTNRSPALRSSA
jgi:hypothetical protein